MATFPERALAWVNSALVAASDAVLGPLMRLPPLVSLLLVSLVTAAAMLVVVARTSNQKAMNETKRGMHAALFEIRLYADEPRAMLRAFGEVLVRNGQYLLLSLVPLLWMSVPLVLVIAQLQAFYGYDGLRPGAAALITVQLTPGAGTSVGAATALTLEAPPEVGLETGAVRLEGSNEVVWRIRPRTEGAYTLTFHDGNIAVTKSLLMSNGPGRRSPMRVASGLGDQVLYPSEAPLPGDTRIVSIAVAYPEPGMDVFGWKLHWLIVYGLLSMACAFPLARRFGVTI
ncbi:MAG: hypothetical protein ABI665_11130 [Vicinamibacterales bacterium]